MPLTTVTNNYIPAPTDITALPKFPLSCYHYPHEKLPFPSLVLASRYCPRADGGGDPSSLHPHMSFRAKRSGVEESRCRVQTLYVMPFPSLIPPQGLPPRTRGRESITPIRHSFAQLFETNLTPETNHFRHGFDLANESKSRLGTLKRIQPFLSEFDPPMSNAAPPNPHAILERDFRNRE